MAELSRYGFFNFAGFFVEREFFILPGISFHYGRWASIVEGNLDVFAGDAVHLANFAIEIGILARIIVFNEHHLCPLFEFQREIDRVQVFGKITLQLGIKMKCWAF